MTPGQLEGTHLKAAALALLAERRAVYVLRGRRALLSALCYRGTATADDVRRAVPLPDNIDPVCMGAVPVELVRAGIIAPDGWTPTARPEGHARPIQRWTLRDRAAALAWLRQHPDQTDPAPDDDAGRIHNGQAFLFPDIRTPGGDNRRA